MIRYTLFFLCALSFSAQTFAEDIHHHEKYGNKHQGDITKGQLIFKKCAVCHTPQKDGPHRVGPNLWNVYGRGIAENPSFTRYSPAFLEKKGTMVWDDENLNTYLENPRTFIPKNKMAFVGLKTPEERAHIIAYLKTLKDDGSAE